MANGANRICFFAASILHHHRLFILLLLTPVLADFTHVALLQIPLDAARMYRTYHLGLFALVLIKLVYVLVTGGLSSGIGLETLLGRGSGFFSRNPNFFDDYAVILICASVWTTVLAVQERPLTCKARGGLLPSL